MTGPFDSMMATLFRGPMAVDIEYTQRGWNPVVLRALEGPPDTEGEVGQVRVGHDVRMLEVPTKDLGEKYGLPYLWEPCRGDEWLKGEDTFRVDQEPHQDLMRLTWIIIGYRISD